MQGEGTGIDDNAAASATSTEHSSPHHPADRDDDVSGQSLSEITSSEEPKEPEGKMTGSGSGYEVPDAREVEAARRRDQQPSEYAGLQAGIRIEEPERAGEKKKAGFKAGSGGGYESLDPREVAEACMRAQQPAEYTGLQARTRSEELEKLAGKKSLNGSGYEVPDPREVEEARMRDQQPVEYTGIQTDTTEDLYSIPKKKKKP